MPLEKERDTFLRRNADFISSLVYELGNDGYAIVRLRKLHAAGEPLGPQQYQPWGCDGCDICPNCKPKGWT